MVEAAPLPVPGVGGVLLTGGASRRLGRDKALLVVDGQRLADRTAALLAQTASPVIEVGPGHTRLPSIAEEPRGGGPLVALAAGAAALAGDAPGGILLVATDLPRLTAGLLVLLARYETDGCVIPVDRSGRPQPVCARYGPEAMELLPSLVGAGLRSMAALLERAPVTWLAPEIWESAAGRPDALLDVDVPEDVATLEAAP